MLDPFTSAGLRGLEGASRRVVLRGAQKNNPWTHGCAVICVAKSKAELWVLGLACVRSDFLLQAMTGASSVPLELLRGGLEDHYKSYLLNEVTGFTNLVGDTDGDHSSNTSSGGIEVVDDLLEGSAWAAVKQDVSGDHNEAGKAWLKEQCNVL